MSEVQQRSFMAFGADKSLWKDFTRDCQNALGRVARAISQYQPLTVFCRANERDLAEEKCGSHNVTYIITELDDIWIRDSGAFIQISPATGQLSSVGFNFNGWGNKQKHSKDAKLAAFMSELYCPSTFRRSALVGEGGGIEVDGHGTAIMTESCWVNANRNPGWSRDQIEQELKEQLGLRKIIWLPGIRGKDITDGHVDFYARFVRPGVVIANLDTDKHSHDYNVTKVQLDILRQSTDADGRPLQVYCLSPPLYPRENRFTDEDDFAAGYINYIIVNGAVIAPEFGDDDADEEAYRLLSELYPTRKVVLVNIDAIAVGGGGIHCVTNELPATQFNQSHYPAYNTQGGYYQ
ncbi:agmatine deiminase [Heterostelium album PN500]|uniref:Agmatine deiminase n=1 Tax=Heterostelium pallidum (strain ATCC 26659 / Pp 5 / PN500) TaxID=670386 RepID=D3BHB2_HETP5|nr:agmatine deiminase [Heterostelium album PN500]EFA79089.1 agmatine deiminase [Heterostelium album PN500]|eukprot:XP_020431211.1 agmatine deiminase [Heterostelium album PN500]